MSTQALIAIPVAAVYALLAALHVYWAFGGRWASAAVIPEVAGRPVFSPSRSVTLAVALALTAASLLVLCRVAVIPAPLPQPMLRFAMYVLGIAFALRALGNFRMVGFFKRTRGTRFATLDSLLFSPLCSALAVAVLWLA